MFLTLFFSTLEVQVLIYSNARDDEQEPVEVPKEQLVQGQVLASLLQTLLIPEENDKIRNNVHR